MEIVETWYFQIWVSFDGMAVKLVLGARELLHFP